MSQSDTSFAPITLRKIELEMTSVFTSLSYECLCLTRLDQVTHQRVKKAELSSGLEGVKFPVVCCCVGSLPRNYCTETAW